MNGLIRHVLWGKPNDLHAVTPTATVYEAVKKMNCHKIGSLLVARAGQPVGIFTERDVLERVIGNKREPGRTLVGEVMTRQIHSVNTTDSVKKAMAMMTEKRCRHLPVMDEGQVVGMVSIGDVIKWVAYDRKRHIEELNRYICPG